MGEKRDWKRDLIRSRAKKVEPRKRRLKIIRIRTERKELWRICLD
jgi:hypothetical protein